WRPRAVERVYVRYAPRKASAKCARLIRRRKPHERLSPSPSRPYSPPTNIPDRIDCARSVRLGSRVTRTLHTHRADGPDAAVIPAARSRPLELRTRRRELLRPDHDPLPVLHLLHLGEI